MIYLSGGRINEMLNIILKLFGATPRKDYQGLGVRRADVVPDVGPAFRPAQPEKTQNADLKVGATNFGATPRKDYQGLGVRRADVVPDVGLAFRPAQPEKTQNADLKVGATNATTDADLKVGATPPDEDELVFAGYPGRPVTARRVEEIAKMAEKLDGRSHRKLIVLAWDYDYNYSAELQKRLKSLGEKPRVLVKAG